MFISGGNEISQLVEFLTLLQGRNLDFFSYLYLLTLICNISCAFFIFIAFNFNANPFVDLNVYINVMHGHILNFSWAVEPSELVELAENRCLLCFGQSCFSHFSVSLPKQQILFPRPHGRNGNWKRQRCWVRLTQDDTHCRISWHSDTQTPDNPKSSSFTRFHLSLARLGPSPSTRILEECD